MISGENGLFEKSYDATARYEEAIAKENAAMVSLMQYFSGAVAVPGEAGGGSTMDMSALQTLIDSRVLLALVDKNNDNYYDMIKKIEDTLNASETTEEINRRLTALENDKVNTSDFDSLVLAKYPVGSIYISIDSTNPGTFLGGTWEAFGQGRTLIGMGQSSGTSNYTSITTGGSETFAYTPAGSVGNHTLTVSEIPAHSHSVTAKGSVARIYVFRYGCFYFSVFSFLC